MSGASAVQKQSLAEMFFKIGERPATLLKRDSNPSVFLGNLENFEENLFFYEKHLLWWLLLAINSVNQWKYTLEVYDTEKKMFTWTVLLWLVSLDKEYSSEFSKHC